MKKVFVLSLISILVFSATFFSPFHTKSDPNEDPTNYNIIPLTYTILEEKEEHIFLDSKESITFNAPLNLKEFHFTRTHATIGSPNSLFLREMNTDLFIETYNYWGENLGGWTDNNEFTIINPKEEKQELFLKISNRYSHRNYVKGFFSGIEHTINFKTQYPADRVSVNWGFTASLKILEINGTQINVADMLSLNNVSIMTEYTFRGISFLMPSPWKIEKTTFNIVIEEIDLPERPNSPRINAWIYPETVVTLNAHQQFDYQIPEIEGWSYSNAGFASNVTPSLHPTPYPFELINLAVWNPNENPVSTTPIDMNFGIRNISNKRCF